jgi:hypothetical protein
MARIGWLVFCAFAVGALVYFGTTFVPLEKDPRTRTALIAGLVIISSWFMTFFFREVSQLIDARMRSKAAQMALSAEIYDFGQTLKVEDQNEIEAALKREFEKGGDFQPFIFSVSEPRMFDVVSDDMRYLSRSATDFVVQFYRTVDDLRSLVDDLKVKEFRNIPAEKRLLAHLDMVEMRILACTLADLAVDELEADILGTSGRAWKSVTNALWRTAADEEE